MINLNDAITFFQANQDQYYSLWTFYFTASAGILGVVYGSDFIRQSFIAKFLATILYGIVVLGNSNAIFITQQIRNETICGIKNSISVNEKEKYSTDNDSTPVSFKKISNNIIESYKIDCDNKDKIQKLRSMTSYWIGTVLVFIGIWFTNIYSYLKKRFRSKPRDISELFNL